MTTDPCRLGERCRERDAKGQPAAAGPRGFCATCERHAQHVLGQLPTDWLHLYAHLGKPLSSLNSGVGAAAVEAPILLRVDIDEVMRHIEWTLCTWEMRVRHQARLSPAPFAGVRPHVRVLRAARLLEAHYSVLLACGPWRYVDYDAQLRQADGLDGVVELVELHYRSRSVVGASRRRERRELPCPPPQKDGSGGCGQSGTLGEWIGDGAYGERVIDCSNCGWHCNIEQYNAYALTFIPPERKAAA